MYATLQGNWYKQSKLNHIDLGDTNWMIPLCITIGPSTSTTESTVMFQRPNQSNPML